MARWVGALDTEKMHRALNGEPEPSIEPALKTPESPAKAQIVPSLTRVSQG